MQNKSVTFLISSLGGGGAERVCAIIASALAQRGWRVTVLTLNDKNMTLAGDLDEQVKLENLGVKKARSATLPLVGYLKQNTVERLVVFSYELTPIAAVSRFFIKNPPVLIARNINSITQKIKTEKSFWLRSVVLPVVCFFYSRVDLIINQCEAMQLDLLRYKPSLEKHCTYIYNPVNEKFRQQGEFLLSKPLKKECFILCVGRLVEQKSFHHAIIAFSKVVQSNPDLRLKIIGTGRLEKELKSLTEQLSVQSNVDFEGFKSNVADYYSKAKLTLLSSAYEGFPNVLLESLSLGTPVVSFDCPSGPKEIITSDIAGELVAQNDTAKLAEAIIKQLNKSVQRKQVLKSIAPFTVNSVIQRWENVLNIN
ncbi:glycosyltransferase [Pseudoalteromonas sp. NEC-BIFX-2020_002]|uniref:glycosyltransferase n=1 Tax=Pseudoalteromonas sp. NEC-BIFX-2020_002 TaxID=2732353 RepID=UPI001476856B|nr:glycosyltransferase [Pseudoalteromonas sp. NEC-BIFX-2020_002]NNG45154.1 glycosyltransferase [Pseudoalteromonas sp. NEC-BIFX-2020_002]